MAKETKTKEVKEETIDFTKPEKVTDKELEELQATIRSIDRLTIDVGRIEIQKYTIVAAMQKVQETIETLGSVAAPSRADTSTTFVAVPFVPVMVVLVTTSKSESVNVCVVYAIIYPYIDSISFSK